MRKRMATAAAIALLAVVFGGVVRTATAASVASTEVTVVVVPGSGGPITALDFEHDGLTQGDRIVFRGPLWDASATHEVGRATGECVVVSAKIKLTTGMWRCSYLLELADGDLIVEGLDPRGPGSSMFAILGGSEGYATAGGDAEVIDTDTGTEFHLHIAT